LDRDDRAPAKSNDANQSNQATGLGADRDLIAAPPGCTASTTIRAKTTVIGVVPRFSEPELSRLTEAKSALLALHYYGVVCPP
jgi:hypothetical protein